MRQVVIQKASLDHSSRSKQEIECWTFNEKDAVYKTYNSVGEFRSEHDNNQINGFCDHNLLEGVRWFHTSFDNKDGIEALGSMFGIETEHSNDFFGCEQWNFEYVCSTTPSKDFLKLAANELRFLHYMDTTLLEEASPSSSSRPPASSADDLALEEVPLMLFLLPDLGVLISIGTPNRHTALLRAARVQLLNRRSVLYRELARGAAAAPPGAGAGAIAAAGRAAGSGALLVVLLDALMDEVFPVLDVFGNVIEGLQILNKQG